MAKILIIDDDPPILNLFGEFLEDAGFSVELASDGKKGLQAIKNKLPDLIITDIMMPEMDGLEILRAVRALSPKLPVIAISGGMRNMPVDFLSHGQTLGACRVLEKPIPLSTLLATVNECLAEVSDA